MKMIGLIGKARAGKTTVGKILESEFEYKRYAMADQIREAIVHGLPFVTEWQLRQGKQSNIPEIGVTGRELLQKMGHEWGRTLNPNMWIHAIQRRIELDEADINRIVIDDVRYDNEVEWIKKHGGIILGVDRPKINADGSVWRSHASESGINPDLVDEWIGNVSCYITDLEYAVFDVMHKLFDPRTLVSGV